MRCAYRFLHCVAVVTLLFVGTTPLNAQLVGGGRIDVEEPMAGDEEHSQQDMVPESTSINELITVANGAEPVHFPEDLQDPAFERYVDLLVLAKAWNQLDPALITDVAMQLAEGERVLLRSHKAITSDELIKLAVKIAADKCDQNTLERLRKYYEQRGDKAMSESLATSCKLAGESRAVDPNQLVSVNEMTPEAFAVYRGLIDEIKAASYVGNHEKLEAITEGIDTLTELSKTQRAYLRTMAEGHKHAIDQLPAEANQLASDETSLTQLALQRLTSTSRGVCTKCSGAGRYLSGFTMKRCDRCGGNGWIPNPIPNPLDNGTVFSGRTKIYFQYTILNSTNVTVRFGLPHGSAELRPGERGSYYFEGYKPHAIIEVYSSGRKYTLNGGDHKFWLMSAGRIGFDSNYSHSALQRVEWVSKGGVLRTGGNRQWVELKNGTVRFRFVETSRTGDFVELYDSGRGYTLRLYQDAMFIRGGKPGSGLSQFSSFTRLVNGSWTK